MHHYIKLKIFIPLAITLIALLLAAIFGFSNHLERHITKEVKIKTQRVLNLFKYSVDQDAKTIQALTDFIVKNPCLIAAWQIQNRSQLLDCAQPIYKQINADYRITHFYFHSLDKKNYLRVHNPKRYGDLINRFTLAQAIKNQQVSYGLELGTYGTFTLRLVVPWKIEGKIMGYIELGEEIEHLTPKVSGLSQIDILFLANKSLITQKKWLEGLTMLGKQEGDWNVLDNYAVIDKSSNIDLANLFPFINKPLSSTTDPNKLILESNNTAIFSFIVNDRIYYVNKVPLYDSNQQRVGIFIAQLDFTQDKQASHKLLSNLAYLFSLIGSVLLLLFWFYLDKIESYIKNLLNMLQDKIKHLNKIDQQLNQNNQQLEKEISHRKSAQNDLEQQLILLDRSNKQSEQLMQQAITARKHTEQLNAELVDARILAESASEAKSQFLSTMSHELRTPMNGMLGMAELLTDTPLNSEQKDYLHVINQSGQSLLNIINDILDFSKIEVGKMQLDPIKFNLEYTINDVVSLLLPKAQEKQLELIVDYEPGCLRHFIGDAGRLRQILMNLLGNAIKFTPSGHVIVQTRCKQLADQQVELHIQVEDTGIGIDSDKVTHLFESFNQLDTSTTRQYGGTGLGLAISKKLVELMQGEIGLSSELGKGTTFWFKLTLPIIQLIDTLPQNNNAEARVLIVDDIEVNRDILSVQIQNFGFETEAVATPEQAINTLLQAQQQNSAFDIAILDYNMPQIDGVALAKLIKKQPSLAKLSLMLLTSSSNKIQADYYRNIGFSAYLCKPAHSDILKKVLNSILSVVQSGQSHPLITRHSIAESEHHQQGNNLDKELFSGKILLAEDVPANQMVACKMLKKLGLEVDVANNGEEAVQMSKESSYQLIFMDCQMPVMDGYQATQAIRQYEQMNQQHIPIIALTANAMKEDREFCLQQGMDDFIAKPFKPKDLLGAIKKWL